MKKVSPLAVSYSPLTVACCAIQRIGLLVILFFLASLISAQDNCPGAGIFLDIPDICQGEELSLEVIRMINMDDLDNGETDFGVNFISFPGTTVPTDPYTGGDLIANVPREGLTGGGDGFYGASTTGGSDLIPNSYIICTTLDPIPSDPACRPSNCQQVNILGGPVVTFVAPDDLCEGARAVALDTGNPSGGSYVGSGVTDNGDGSYIFDPVTAGVGTHTINYTFSDRDDCSTTVMDDIEVFANPIATISDPEDRCTGGVDAIFIGGPNLSGTFDSDAIAGFTDNSDGSANLDVSVAGPGTYTVNYNYTDENGCSATVSTEISICESLCPTIDLFADLPDLCEFQEINLIIDRMTLIDSLDNQETDYGILFTAFSGNIPPADPYIDGDSLTFVERGDIMGGADGFYNLNTTVTNILTAGSYNICATLNPLPGDPLCRPFLCQQISVLAAPEVTFTGPADLCDDDLPVALNTGTPTGGIYYGEPGVINNPDRTYSFDPAIAGGGVHIISYEISNRDGCSNIATDTVMVFPLPTLSITLPATTCENVPAFDLNENPTGGTLSGNGIVGNNFDPAIAGVGVHTITYDFTDANNCSNSTSETIEVFAAPIVNFSALPDLCSDGDVQMNITGGIPLGGTYSGPGVTNNPDSTYSFNPATAGVGMHIIEYTFIDGNGCETVASDEVEVFALPIVTFVAPMDLCSNAGVQSGLVGGTPAEGMYSGPGVTNNSDGTYDFDPVIAGAGTHSINYTYATPDFVEVFDNISFDDVTNFLISDASSTVISSDDFTLAVDQNIIRVEWSGVYSGTTIPATDDFTIVIYSDGVGMPGTVLSTVSIGDNVNRTDTGIDNSNGLLDIYSYNATIPSFSATAGTNYWISIYNNTPAGNTWSWGRKVGGGNGIASFDQGNTWTLATGGEFDFRLAASAVSCTNTATDTVEVFASTMVSFTALADLCIDAGIQMNIVGGTPSGGIYSGPGVINNADSTYSFDPVIAGAGIHIIEYTFTEGNGCEAVATDEVEVFVLPIVTFTAPMDLCVDAGIQSDLGGGTPAEGIYSGPGVVNNTDGTYDFDPVIAGAGIHPINYTYATPDSVEVFDNIGFDAVTTFLISDATSTVIAADDFVFATDQEIITVAWSGVYSGTTIPATDDFTIVIYSDGVGMPGTVLSTVSIGDNVNRTDTEIDNSNGLLDIYSYNATIPPFSATAGTIYWISIYNNTPAGNSWSWGRRVGGGNGIASFDQGNTWTLATGGEFDFRLAASAVSCTNTATDMVEVFATPDVSFSALADLCIDAGVQMNISGGSPTGGSFTGPGVTDNGDGTYNFDPVTAGVGRHTITYIFTDGNSCDDTVTDMVEVFATPDVSFSALADLCIEAGVQLNISGGSPTGGSFMGTGVTDNGDGTYNFDPLTAGVGIHTITYIFTDGNSCDDTVTDEVEVFAIPDVSFTALADLCIDAGVQLNIIGGSPTGGSFTGPGVTDNGDGTYNFDPLTAGVGTHTITYIFTDGNSCDDTVTDEVEVFAMPDVSFTALADLCIDAGVQLNIGGGSPTGGSFTGTGVTDNGDGTYDFDPVAAGVGMHNIEYVFSNSNGCEDMASDIVEVFNLPIVTEIHQDISECTGVTNGSIDLTIMDNGIFNFNWTTVDGSGLIAGSEDQDNLSAGVYMVTVINEITFCDTTLTIEIIEETDLEAPVINCPPDTTISCIDDQSISNLGIATATDNCDPSPVISFVENSNLTGCSGTGQIIRTWTAIDSSNNRVTCEQIINIVDNDAPVFDMLSTVEVVDCPQNIPVPIPLTATDECTGPITLMPEITTVNQTCDNNFTRIYTYNFVDDCGNATIFTQTYQVVSSPPTLLNAPPNYTVACELDIVLYPHLVSVNSSCDGPLQISSELNGPFGAAGCSGSTYEAVYSWSDGCHRDSVVQVYTLENEGPEFVCPTSICVIDCFDDSNLMQNTFDEYANLATVNTSCSANTVTITNDFTENNFINNNCGTGSSVAYPNALEYQVVTFIATDVCNRSTTCTALVVVVDDTAPEFNGTPVVGFADCGSDVQATYDNWVDAQIARLDANDVCGFGGSVTLDYRPETPVVGDGISSVTPVTFTASDGCGNSNEITVSFVVESGGGPAFAQVPVDETITCNEIPAIFGDVILYESCSPATITFEDVYVSGDIFSCDNQEIAVLQRTWTATDAAENTATASQQITIIPGRANVAGTIFTEEDELVSDVHLAVYLNNGMMDEQTTTEAGTYDFELPVQNNYEIIPTRNDHPLNGITTYDLVLLGQHLLEINTLESPYQLIAADVNNSGSVTALDMIALRRMILVIDTEFPNNESWRFIDADYLFPNSDNPFLTTFPESHNINGLSNDLIRDFIAIKTGDLNQSVVTSQLTEGEVREDRPSWLLEMQDELLYRGQEYVVPVTAPEDGVVNGFQYTLTFDPDLVEVIDVAAGSLKGMNAENFGTHALDQGWLTTSWHQPYPVDVSKGDTLFTLKFVSKENIALNKLFSINSLKTPAEMYTESKILRPSLTFKTKGTYQVFQNVPNPFSASTTIGFKQPEAGTVGLTVFDVTGQEIYRTVGDFERGFQEFKIQKKDLSANGIFFYRIDFKNYSNVKKMILIE